MASNFYSRIHADYEDLDNDSGRRPGFLFEIKENDGGVGICLYPGGELTTDEPEIGRAQVFMTAAEARDLMTALQEAIERAEFKNRDSGRSHPPRSREPT